jgi:hypothetical protein
MYVSDMGGNWLVGLHAIFAVTTLPLQGNYGLSEKPEEVG